MCLFCYYCHMNVWTLLVIAVSLAMDAFAVSVACGFSIHKLRVGHVVRIALFFGFFQGMMPVVGWLAGIGVRSFVQQAGHWIAFALLCAIGIKMLFESSSLNWQDKNEGGVSVFMLIVLSFATSIDALVVGVSISLLNASIISAAFVIGIVTFVLSAAGVWIGDRLGHVREGLLEKIAGIALILIGIYILISHLV